ncbi:ATP-binding cassette domain-containing protein [Spiroplasma endosymbiont of Tiphia femorata]|uniref:ATP-binding cassette domain-containing protein n=2 Tax=unclassified Spiroplasma TaxID=2637901 RepID=UPI0030CE8AA4
MIKDKKNNVEIINVSKNYDSNEVIKNVSLNIAIGAKIGIVGPNGTGKTTLCEMISQLRKPTTGTINIKSDLKIGMQLQETKFPRGLTGWDMAQYYMRAYCLNKSVEDIQKLLYYLDAEAFINKPIITLSGGQQQKINILLALIVEPDLLILDELATGLDLEVRERIYELLEKEVFIKPNLSVLIVSHNMQEIERFCQQIIFMFEGSIISINDVKTVVKEYGSIEEYVKTKFKEYKIGMYDSEALLKRLGGENNEKWAKSWKNTLKNKNNDWSLLNLFWSYLKRNRSIIIFSVFVSPLIFIGASIGGNNQILSSPAGKNIGRFILMIIWLTQTASFSIQTFLAILLDLKQSVVYRRIGLTRISKTNFIIITSIFNLALVLISDIIIFIGVIIIGYVVPLSGMISSIFNWQLLIIILFTLFFSITITSIALLMSVIIKSRTGQAIVSLFTSLLIVAPLIILTYFLASLIGEGLVSSIGVGAVVGILVGIFIALNLISCGIYYLT